MAQSLADQYQSKFMLQARLVRRAARRFLQSQHHPLSNAPILFANSFPKSGTHLLTQVLAGFAQFGPAVVSGLPAIITYEGDTGRQRHEAEIEEDLERLLPGDIAYGHLHALPGVVEFLCKPEVAAYFILRDPRDVVVSHVHYVTEMQQTHIHHHYYKDVLISDNERITASIVGRDDLSAGISFPNIRARFEPYLGWLERPEILVLRFEDFITHREQALNRVLEHAVTRGFTPSCDHGAALSLLARSIDPDSSPTFRSGRIGSWRAVFTEEHKTIFKEISGDLLLQLGYETDIYW